MGDEETMTREERVGFLKRSIAERLKATIKPLPALSEEAKRALGRCVERWLTELAAKNEPIGNHLVAIARNKMHELAGETELVAPRHAATWNCKTAKLHPLLAGMRNPAPLSPAERTRQRMAFGVDHGSEDTVDAIAYAWRAATDDRVRAEHVDAGPDADGNIRPEHRPNEDTVHIRVRLPPGKFTLATIKQVVEEMAVGAVTGAQWELYLRHGGIAKSEDGDVVISTFGLPDRETWLIQEALEPIRPAGILLRVDNTRTMAQWRAELAREYQRSRAILEIMNRGSSFHTLAVGLQRVGGARVTVLDVHRALQGDDASARALSAVRPYEGGMSWRELGAIEWSAQVRAGVASLPAPGPVVYVQSIDDIDDLS
jgi:hypothetical protein